MDPRPEPRPTATTNRRVFCKQMGAAAVALHATGLAQTPVTPAVVQTPSGRLRGQTAGSVRSFRGVPFAEPPVGPLRFRRAVKIVPWPGERSAVHFAPKATQPGEGPSSEDCLYLNLWAPTGKGPYPVFVWIHGGGFTGGSPSEPTYDGSEFAAAGVICVTVAYRLGVFGFLDVEPLLGATYAGSANNALSDLIAALSWVRENIAAFGGDPEQVTVGGESAGAKLTDILMGTPAAKPLFQQMISESGGAERVWPRDNAVAVAKGFAELLKKQADPGSSDLLQAPASTLLACQEQLMTEWPQHFPLRPQLDGSLLPRLPIDTIASGATSGKRLLIGTNRDESALFLGPHPQREAKASDLGNMPLAAFNKVLSQYPDVYPQMSPEDRLIRAVTAEEYWIPSMRVAEAHLRGGGQAWMYRLDFAEASGRLRGYAYHSLDVGLVWDKPHAAVTNARAEAALGQQIHAAWVSFIQGHAPAAPGLPAWPAYNNTGRPTMILDTVSHVEQQPQAAELLLWKGLL